MLWNQQKLKKPLQPIPQLPPQQKKLRIQQLQEAQEGETVIQIKYSDTDAMFDRQVKKALREFGIPEDVIQEQNFKYGQYLLN